jgi:phosphatidylglycerol:prolipoprotein diacylglycerol transferase
MHPTLFELFGVQASSFYVLIITAGLFATAVASLTAERIGERGEVMPYAVFIAVIAGLFGARLLHVVAEGDFWTYVHLCTDPSQVDVHLSEGACRATANGVWDAAKNVCHPRDRDCLEWLAIWDSGKAYYGGVIGAIIGVYFFLRREGFPIGKGADIAAIVAPLAQGVGRLGCLLAGCCFGATCPLPWGVSFPPGSPASSSQIAAHAIAPGSWSIPVHPTQLYEAVAGLAISAFVLLWVHPRKRYDGQVSAATLALYAIARFLIEFVRDDVRGSALGLSTSQLIGIVALLGAGLIHWRAIRERDSRRSD